jgi:Uma2 family endonuclease
LTVVTTIPEGAWKFDDLFSLPDGKRYEIIAGDLFELPTPGTDHATAVVNVLSLLHPEVRSRGGMILTGPIGVFMRDADPVLPDILVVLPDQLHLLSKRGIEGAPSLLVEVLCAANPRHDRLRKRFLYARAGVREYWIVSPEAAAIEVWTLGDDDYDPLVRAGGDESVTSKLFPDLTFLASDVFGLLAPTSPR